MIRKILLVVALSFFACCFAEDFKGFLNIPFGTSKKECYKIMRSNGWHFGILRKDFEQFSGKTYGGKKPKMVTFMYEDGKLVTVCVEFSNALETTEVLNALIEKYELKRKYESKENKFFLTKDFSVTFAYMDKRLFIEDSNYAERQIERNKVDKSDL